MRSTGSCRAGELTDKPVALIVASPGGGQLAQTALAETLRVMGALLVVDVTLPFARRDVDADNRVSDPDLAQKLASSLEALLLAIRAR
jgi:NAD(P)H-dependent FMN reductase